MVLSTGVPMGLTKDRMASKVSATIITGVNSPPMVSSTLPSEMDSK